MLKDEKDSFGFYFVLAATFMFAFKGVLAKLIYAQGAAVNTVLFYRFSVALPIFLVFGFVLRAKSGVNLSQLDRRLIRWGIFSGLLFFLSATFDFHAIDLMEVSIQRMLLFTYPIFILILNILMGIEKVNARLFVLAVLMMLGVALVLDVFHQDWSSLPWLGVGLTAVTAINYALYMIISQRAKRYGTAIDFSMISFTTASLCLLVSYPFMGSYDELNVNPHAILLLGALIVFSTVFPFYLMTAGVQRLGSSRTGILTMLGPGITIIGSMLLLGEELSALQWSGIFLLYGCVAYMKVGKDG